MLDLSTNYLYCLPNDSHHDSLENLVLDQFVILRLMFFFILIPCLHDRYSEEKFCHGHS